MKTYLVGGAVRDMLMGKSPHDKDYVIVGATAKDIQQLRTRGFIQVGADFPVFLHPITHEEYALARTEKKTGVGYKGFSCDFTEHVSLVDDLSRRDLTVNSMAIDLETGNLIDPFNGSAHIQGKILVPTSNAFKDDPLRVLRAARFSAQLQFKLSPQLITAMQEIALSGELTYLTAERVLKELETAFAAEKPSMFLFALRDAGCLQQIFPELYQLPLSAIMLLDHCRKYTSDNNNFKVLLATLMHRIGLDAAQNFCKRLKIPTRVMNFALNFTKYYQDLQQSKLVNAQSVVALLKSLRCISNISLLNEYLLCAYVNDGVKASFAEYPTAIFLNKCATAIRDIDKKEIIKNLAPAQIPEVMDQAMAQAIKNFVE